MSPPAIPLMPKTANGTSGRMSTSCTQLTNVFVGLHGGPSKFKYTELTDLDEFEAKGLHLALVSGANMYFSNRFGFCNSPRPSIT